MTACPKCQATLVRRANMFFWRGHFFSGLVCEPCGSLWNDPDDSFEAAVMATKKEQDKSCA